MCCGALSPGQALPSRWEARVVRMRRCVIVPTWCATCSSTPAHNMGGSYMLCCWHYVQGRSALCAMCSGSRVWRVSLCAGAAHSTCPLQRLLRWAIFQRLFVPESVDTLRFGVLTQCPSTIAKSIYGWECAFHLRWAGISVLL
eukprot:TRINITY_DN22941_c0_g1_i1.p1 TRINITY_DN22941_c0_g1~~TRINITY_DN22941_c0_g1_i1.p1  ORF type:complete len:143 (+),score=1.22 TRINITY_DN22941_c0_g1_i1:92-520(+)